MSRHRRRTDAPRAPGPIFLLGDGLLLYLGLAGTVLSWTTAYGLGGQWGILLAGCLLLVLLSLAVWSVPRHSVLPPLVLGVCWLLAVWRLWDDLRLGWCTAAAQAVESVGGRVWLLDRILAVGAETAGGISGGPEAERAVTLWLLCAAALWALLLGWAVVRRRRCWPVGLLTLPLLIPAFAANRLPDWPPFLALLTCCCTMFLSELYAHSDPKGGARFTLLALPASALLLGLLTATLPMEQYAYPQRTMEARYRLLEALRLPGMPNLFSGGYSSAGSEAEVDLAGAGPLSFSGRTVLRVETDVAGRVYLRGHSAGVYTGTAWESLDESLYEAMGELPGGYEPLNFPALANSDQPYHAVTVESAGASGGCLYFPYSLLTRPGEISGGAFVGDSCVAKELGTWRHTLYYRPEAGPRADMPGLRGEVARAERVYREFVHENYLTLPEGFQETAFAWIEEAIQAAGPLMVREPRRDFGAAYEGDVYTAEVISLLLAAVTRYDPATPLTPEGEDFVTYFLNGSRRGYCMHYASAAVLLLRTVGIPARYVSGFAAVVPPSGRVDVPDSSAHAWVEIYLDGYGWYPVEVTPGYGGGGGTTASETPSPSQIPAPETTPTPTRAPTTGAVRTPAPTQTLPPDSAHAGDGEAEKVAPLLRWMVPPGLGLILLAALCLRRRLLREKRLRRLEWEGETNQAVLAAYGYLQRLLPWGGQENARLEELACKAKFSQHRLTEKERGEAATLVLREAGRVDAALPVWKRLAFRYLWGLF
ncbi:transglutaminase-like domain-containing protein [Intestinimonas butyriciproducens]|uniref:Transglutaminase superfamily protein n=1 Tax=Intestinimonas butyriciproducens TaxID=1297617 RepID=A0A2U1C115_9FIRM|nr:transglutaminase-like domain-containing protein [Intestinimonas butyriciproducens]MCR1906817.1 transglutaminase-like domain-containing protein [Intestinimonas butyriciproducens]PVY54598.1 transglutaminase superfamily protein [Intestinimonas butyriciproducens]QBB66720.1 Transglutaminase, cysteine protease [Intestinimonas butyriciproducens]